MSKEKEDKKEIKKEKVDEGLLAQKLNAQAKLIKKMGVSGCVAVKLEVPEVYPTGLPVFDQEVIGIGGLPKGRIVEVYGIKSSGKTALCLHLAAAVQKQDPVSVVKIYDQEHSCTKPWLSSMGLDLSRTIVIGSPDQELSQDAHPISAEEMGAMIQADIALGNLAPNIIIIDSIAVIQTEGVMETEFEDRSMKDNLDRAAFLTKFFDSVTGGFYYPAAGKDGNLPAGAVKYSIGGSQVCLMCVNHAKERTKKAGARTYIEWYSVGGVSLDFHACLQLMVKRIGFEKGPDGNVSHQKISIIADKNKVAPPKRGCEVLLSFAGGIEQVGIVDYLSMAVAKGLATVNGAWIESALLPKGKMQGREAFNKFVDESPEIKKVFSE